MNNTTIADVSELSKGAPINNMTVSVKKAYEPGEGEGQHGPWRMQGVILQDETGEIRATFWNRFNQDLRNFEGEQVTITSGRDGKDRFSGITTDEYKGKVQLKVSEKAVFSSPDGELPDASEPDMSQSSVANNGEPIERVNTRKFVSEETKRASIEKQVALKAAVDLAVGTEQAQSDKVIEWAGKFYKFLHGEPEVI